MGLFDLKTPSKEEQNIAKESHQALATVMERLRSGPVEIMIKGNPESLRVPLNALKHLADIIKETSQRRMIAIVPVASELTPRRQPNF